MPGPRLVGIGLAKLEEQLGVLLASVLAPQIKVCIWELQIVALSVDVPVKGPTK